MNNKKPKQSIQTPIGLRERCSIGEVTVPTYYGALQIGDKKLLVKRGYELREVRKASGIRENGNLVVFTPNGFYYEVGAPKGRA